MRTNKTNGNEGNKGAKPLGLALASFVTAILLGICPASFGQFYQQTNLVSDVAGVAAVVDTNLMGAWGITHTPTSPWWVNSTIGGVSLIINGLGQPQSLVVSIPPTNHASVTGIAYNGDKDFEVASNAPAIFIFATLNGTISGWSPGQSNIHLAVLEVNNEGTAGYTGVTIAQNGGVDYLYAANFIQGRVEVFDTNFHAVTIPAAAFKDKHVPAGLKVFNVQAIGGDLYVTYAPANALGGPGVPGEGYVSIFEPNGKLQGNLQHGPWMEAPWGVTVAPGDFGRFSRKFLVGMFGSGTIAAFDNKEHHGHFRGVLQGTDEAPLTVSQGLWGLGFGNGTNAGPANVLYFAQDLASTNGFHGLFGAIRAVPGTGPDGDGDLDDNVDNNQ